MKTFPEYEFHRISQIFPFMSDAEIDELAEDIKVNGLTCPIVLYEGKILDGRNRFLACKKADVMPDFWEYPGDTPVQFALSLNLHRRHLTTSQRSAIAAELATLPQGARTDLASNEARFSQSEAAEIFDVSRSGVQRAVEVKTADLELLSQVKAGELSLEDARRAIAPTTDDSATGDPPVTSWTAPETNGDHGETDTQPEEDAGYPDGPFTIPQLAEGAAPDDASDEKFVIKEFKLFIKEHSKVYGISSGKIKSYIRTYFNPVK